MRGGAGGIPAGTAGDEPPSPTGDRPTRRGRRTRPRRPARPGPARRRRRTATASPRCGCPRARGDAAELAEAPADQVDEVHTGVAHRAMTGLGAVDPPGRSGARVGEASAQPAPREVKDASEGARARVELAHGRGEPPVEAR